MSRIIDRRLNGKNKSAVNRQRFLDRFKHQIKRAVTDAISNRSITDIEQGEKVSIPTKDIAEPTFGHGPGGVRDTIYPGNEEFTRGDRVPRPGGGKGRGRGKKASNKGEGMDEFAFELSREEFMDYFFDDLALPDLVKKELAATTDYKWRRAGFTNSGVPSNINVIRSMRSAIGRRIALGGPYRAKLRELEEELEKLLLTEDENNPRVRALKDEIDTLRFRINAIPFIDTFDLRYNNRVRFPEPSTQAVMFCLMDVSGSMDQSKKDIAKRFFILLYLFLTRNYEKIDVVFICHHTVAREVDEHDFFYSRETGGTVVSSALKLMKEIMHDRYPASRWNIYAAQASDGDNWHDDSSICRNLILNDIMPFVQYYAYVEITPDVHQSLWREYLNVKEMYANFAMQRIESLEDIYPVFRKLFQKQPQ